MAINGDATFSAGATLTSQQDFISDGFNFYYWTGAFNKVVPAGSTPESSGGIGDGAWKCVGDEALRVELASVGTGQGAALIGLRQGGNVQQAIDWITPQMFGALNNGTYDDAVAINKAVAYAESINSSVSTRAPRVGVYFPSGKYYLKQPVNVSKGTTSWRGAGCYQTYFIAHSEANNPSFIFQPFFNFSAPEWTGNSTRTLNEINLSDFSCNFSGCRRPAFYLGGVGWDSLFSNIQIWGSLAAFVCDDLWDTLFINIRIVNGGNLHNPTDTDDIFTHQIIMRDKYDNCNAIRFIAPHFEGNYNGVYKSTGRTHNVSFDSMPKFENNSIGTKSENTYPVIDIVGSLCESIRFNGLFVSHPASVSDWFFQSQGRHISINSGSYMSPSDTSGQTAKKWFRFHRDNWNPSTLAVGAIVNIDLMHIEGLGDIEVAPISIENKTIIHIAAPRIVNPNKFIDIAYGCDITIDDLTVTGTVTENHQSALFNITTKSSAVNINVKIISGSVTGIIYTNSFITTSTRRASEVNLRGRNQNTIGTLADETDPFGFVEGYNWQASGLVKNIGYCNTGRKIVVHCLNVDNRLVGTGGNIFLPGSEITSPCYITLQAMNWNGRQGWVETSRINGS